MPASPLEKLSSRSTSSIVVEGLGKRYRLGGRKKAGSSRELWALKDVSFTTSPGVILGIIGPNGAGKTTLLKVLSRITPPTEGRVTGRGRVIPLLGIDAGFHPDLSGRENVFLSAALFGIRRAEIAKKIDEIFQFAGVQEFEDVRVKRYSSGMYLRLAFSTAIHLNPDILLADEVLAVGDADFQERCLQRIQEAAEKQGMTVLFVSHNMAAITRLCHDVIWLNSGRLVARGAPEDIVNQYQSTAWMQIPARRGEGAIANEYGELLSTQLCAEGGTEIGAVEISDDHLVKVNFRVLMPSISFRVILDLHTRGVHAFRSVQPFVHKVEEAGVYQAVMKLPAHLLAETVYSANVIIKFHKDDLETQLVDYNALAFKAFAADEIGSARGTYPHPLGGTVMPRLEWKVTKQAHAVQT